MTKRTLVVEDQEDNRRIIRDLLMSAGYELVDRSTARRVCASPLASAGSDGDGHPAAGSCPIEVYVSEAAKTPVRLRMAGRLCAQNAPLVG